MDKKTYIAAMSGGVDSSVAASIYKEAGHKVIGVTLKMKSCDDTKEKTKACCGLDDNIQARLVADKLDIPHYFLDVRDKFKENILKYAWREYKSGRTPNPCVLCNFYLKFGALIEFAKKLSADGIITGHYAIIKRENGSVRLFKGIDDLKNQTYFLAGLNKEQLMFSYMPLGELRKTEVRVIAEKLNLPNAKKSESQDACFGYKGETFSETLSRNFEEKPPKGKIVLTDGKVVGEHNGIHNFTIGQRKGLNIALGKPAYVVEVNKIDNSVIISTDKDDLLCQKFYASGMNWLNFPYNEFKCKVQTRYRQSPIGARVIKLSSSESEVLLEEPARAVTAGQTLAVYDNDELIAGGWIEREESQVQNKHYQLI